MSKTKKYALRNSYFKHTLYNENYPKEPLDIWNYYQKNKELPFDLQPEGDFVYDYIVEYQKKQVYKIHNILPLRL